MGAFEIAYALAASRKAVQLYPPEHPTHREAIRDLTVAVNEAVDVRPLALNLHRGRLFHGSDVLTEAAPATRAIAEAMRARRIESLTFHIGFAEMDADGLSQVLSLKPSPDLDVQAELDERGVRAVTISELEDESVHQAEERDRRREADRALYRQAVSALRSIRESFDAGAEVDGAVGPRALAALIASVAEKPEAGLALAQMTGHGDPALFHAMAVSLYSLVLGGALKLPDEGLLALGLAALLHDIGKSAFDLSDPAQAEEARVAHPLLGAQMLGALPDEDRSAMLVAYEHHMGLDGTGWPERPTDHVTHPYSRIVAVADRYDNLVRAAGGGEPEPPDAALATILREASGGPLDPILTRMFAQAMGAFPIGCPVRLSDMSVGFVASPGPEPLRPRVRVVLGPDGGEIRPALDADLAEEDRSIVEVLDARILGLTVSDHL